MLQALDSAERTFRLYSNALNNHGALTVRVDVDSSFPDTCPTSCADSRTDVWIPTDTGTGALHGDRVSHEIGHTLQMREFFQDKLRDDTSLGGNGWSITSAEWDSAVTTEGWASYAGALSWYKASTAIVPLYGGFDIEEPAMTNGETSCSNAEDYPLQGMKAFWDLDDANNELGEGPALGDDDTADFGSGDMLNRWDSFPNGTGNRDDYESGVNGVNTWDYRFSGNVTNEETLLRHNCMDAQVN